MKEGNKEERKKDKHIYKEARSRKKISDFFTQDLKIA